LDQKRRNKNSGVSFYAFFSWNPFITPRIFILQLYPQEENKKEYNSLDIFQAKWIKKKERKPKSMKVNFLGNKTRDKDKEFRRVLL